jgi:hypothetical protein
MCTPRNSQIALEWTLASAVAVVGVLFLEQVGNRAELFRGFLQLGDLLA